MVASREITRLGDHVWEGVKTSAPLTPGTYYLEATAPDGPVAWWSLSSDGYTSGTAYENGVPVRGDRGLYLQSMMERPVKSPGFVDGVAEGVTFDSDGIVIRRDDGTGFSYDYAPA
ncbi:hypothetical protein G7085_06405 [Tessaracoccus sp. HDW20]|uniref:hypothetical protein n=1 Tax=Tessaracoccus coleopterorum TaxID=2714950 RepID=UPI0018D4C528|nr:hypothetical protein [Tessaracoccus coleopterorum]NHB84359.1 hypothetical protein [Tessaracoccus coleopterorum]